MLLLHAGTCFLVWKSDDITYISKGSYLGKLLAFKSDYRFISWPKSPGTSLYTEKLLSSAQMHRHIPVKCFPEQAQPQNTIGGGLTVAARLPMLALLWNVWIAKWEVNEPRFGLKFSLLVTMSVLVSPHLNFHDLADLSPRIDRGSPGGLESPEPGCWLRVSFWAIGCPVILSTSMIFTYVPIQLSLFGDYLSESLVVVMLVRQYTESFR